MDINVNTLPTIVLSKNAKDLTGQKKGKLLFLKPAENKSGRIYWWVQCDCGAIEKVRSDTNRISCLACSKQLKSEHLKGKKMIDLKNKRFNRLTALYPTEERRYGKVVWHCRCDCGNECDIASSYLINGTTQSCGCLRDELTASMGHNTAKNLTNQRFGWLTAIQPTDRRSNHCIVWECLCDCGKICYVSSGDLLNNGTKSCGCQKYNKEMLIKNIIGQKFGKLLVLERVDKDSDGSYNYLCQCDCGMQKIINGVSLRQGITTSCGCINYSIGEKNIAFLLQQNNIPFVKEYSNKELQYKRFDFAILNNNQQVIRFIEFDGRQHYEESNSIWEKASSLSERQKRDQIKNEYTLSHNIPLVRIPYWERDNITLDMIMGDQYLVK